jgi:flagellar motor switch protein FliG
MIMEEREPLSIFSLDEIIEGFSRDCFGDRIVQDQIIDWLKELRNYKQADGTLQKDSNNFHDILKEEFARQILSLSNRSLQKVIQELVNEDIVRANKNASKEVWDKFLQNMTKRRQEMMIEKYEYMGPIRLNDSLSCQRKIRFMIYHLKDTGEIEFDDTGTVEGENKDDP